MTNKATKYGIMIIVAVLVIAMAFAGVASAFAPIYVATGGGETVSLSEVGESADGKQGTVTLVSITGDTYTLKLNNYNVTSDGYPIIQANVPNLTIKLVGDSNLTGCYANSDYGLLYSSGNLTITTDNAGKLLVNNTETECNAVYAAKDVIITDGTVNATATGSGSVAIYTYSGNVTIENGMVTATAKNQAIYANYDVTIANGTVTATAENLAIYAVSGNVTINNGTVTATATGSGGVAICTNSGSITISDGTVTATAESQAISAGNDVTITNGTVTATATGSGGVAICANSGSITISDGTVTATAEYYAIYANYDVTISDGTVTATATGSGGVAIYVSSGNVTMEKGTVNVTATGDDGFAILATNNVTIEDGTVTATATGTGGYGIYAIGGNIIVTSVDQLIANGTNAAFAYSIARDFSALGDDYEYWVNATGPALPLVKLTYEQFNASGNWTGTNPIKSVYTNVLIKPVSASLEVNTSAELENAFADASVKTIVLGADIQMDEEITINNNKILDLNGKTLTAAAGYRLFIVSSGKTFTLNNSLGGGKLVGDGSFTGDYGGGVFVDSNSTFTMNGGTITNCRAVNGGGVFVDSNSTFTMNDGSITNCSSTGSSYGNGGGAVCVDGEFTMNGGNITNCNGKYGGAVYVDGEFTINGGNITGCSATYGGGVFIETDCTFTMNGGNITDCSANLGGGVYVLGTFIMNGGTITNCSANSNGGGVCCILGTFNVSGSATISCNTKNGIANNVPLGNANNLNLVGPFTGSVSIAYPEGAVDTPFGKYVSGNTDDAKNFISDTPGYFGKVNSSANTLVWALINTTVTPTAGTAEFSGTNTTTLVNNDKVSVVLLENVSNVGTSPVTFNASSPVTTPLPAVNGYTKEEDVAIFEITATSAGTSTINLTVTFKDAANATANKDKVRIFHYTAGTWQPLTSSIVAEDGTKIAYSVETDGFSPFGIGIYSAVAPSYTPSSSSQSGGSVLLQPGQVAPTQQPTVKPTVAPTAKPTEKPATPTVAPTANPTAQQTQASPAPFAGLVLGLGAAAVLLRLRK